MEPMVAFEQSYARVFGDGVAIDPGGEAFFHRFYEIFLSEPGVAEMFDGVDMAAQEAMLRSSFFRVLSYHVTGEWTPELDRVGEVHANLGIDPDLFQRWLECLLETVRQVDPDADEETLLGWRLALLPGLTCMTHWTAVRRQHDVQELP